MDLLKGIMPERDITASIDTSGIDLSKAVTLEDCNELIGIETHFKLCAGPGAGKTRFLVKHINNVIANSKRLTKVKKIACITYTNIGVETIKKRLDDSINEVEVNTIHGFLYNHVIKPYLWIINEEYGIPLADVDGHDEVIPTYSILKEWKKVTKQTYIEDKDNAALREELGGLRWSRQSDGEIVLKLRFPSGLMVRNNSLIEYKKICWKKAKISHDDVLFLSYKILKENNYILEILRAKFPYIFIDEFQDTHPIQSEIIKMIGEKETIIGVIGDYGQSIFEFIGANVQDFVDFELEGMELYKIENNHRSTEEIISVLNHIRNESAFVQTSPDNKSGNNPQIIVGEFIGAYKAALKISGSEPLCSLSYRNDIANIMKFGYTNYFDSAKMNEFLFKESNGRSWRIGHTITAIEYCRQGKIKDAIKYMKKAYRTENFSEKEALENLIRLINCYDLYRECTIKEFYNSYLYDHYGVQQEIRRGAISDYYDSKEYKEIAVGVRINDDDSIHRTIHKSKGAEFNSVFVIIPSEEELNFLLNPNIEYEDNRVYYVALSRAIENLFINVPQLSEENKEKLEEIGFEVVELDIK